ncbi:arsenite efflux ATP-binding protein ArsA [Sinobaca qinghaiensis]|uniref:Arsenite efflux ATP-binding protein ArsA n=1 Tax=Sinobaca qinghaiensis TaxID=342944 RepID=A0A419V5B5_9BACL|nr:arsenical pump-driving ATPase [Sinobaca qinghaiensis]RKD73641.1 arsenite efflux ATP-binding protein ArsA [Sinobaca qinghaiensis]
MERLQAESLGSTRYLFFTGKGGVGKTTTACAIGTSLADSGKNVLLVSTDPASNLQDVFEQEIGQTATAIASVSGLHAINLDPEEAAETYRNSVVGPYRGLLPEDAIANMEEQLSGACTTEIAAFDEFSHLLTDKPVAETYDFVLFDTAPTGHTLRLLQLPLAWSSFLETSDHGASCLGPLSGLEAKKELYQEALHTLSDREQTSLILVARPDTSSLKEAERAGHELQEIGIVNQTLIVNGLFERSTEDETAVQLEQGQQKALEAMPAFFTDKQRYYLPLFGFHLTGMDSLRRLWEEETIPPADAEKERPPLELPSLSTIVEKLAPLEKGVFMTMGKGGVGKTTVAASVAMGLVKKGLRVHLTTTDPANHLSYAGLTPEMKDKLKISSIDPKQVVADYKNKVLADVKQELSEEELAYIKEDLESPCTEEIAVFQAFAEVVEQADDEFVIIDTAPTGHTLLLLDSAGSYEKEVERSSGSVNKAVSHLLPRLRNPLETFVAVVTLPEATPVLEAERLQEDLKRASIQPQWWVINQSLYGSGTKDPVLQGRSASEYKWIHKVNTELAERAVLIPWKPAGAAAASIQSV